MRIVRARWQPLRLPLRTAVAGHGGERPGALVVLEDDHGRMGGGEAGATPGFPSGTPAEILADLEAGAKALLCAPAASLADHEAAIAHLAPGARAGLSAALWDLACRAAAVPLARAVGEALEVTPRPGVPVSALVTGASAEAAAREAAAHVAAGVRTLKLKLRAAALGADLERIGAVRRAVGGGVALRVDANAALPEAEARDVGPRLAELGVVLLEQPVDGDDLEALARLRRDLPVPVAADEAAATPARAARVLAARAADVLVLKPSVAGGIVASLEIAELARQARVPVIVTSALDGALGITAALHVAAAAATPGLACGLATADLLADDVARAPRARKGEMAVPEDSGLGVVADEEALARLAAGAPRELTA